VKDASVPLWIELQLTQSTILSLPRCRYLLVRRPPVRARLQRVIGLTVLEGFLDERREGTQDRDRLCVSASAVPDDVRDTHFRESRRGELDGDLCLIRLVKVLRVRLRVITQRFPYDGGGSVAEVQQ